MTNSHWHMLIKKHNAIVIKKFGEAKRFPDRAVAFETQNFGWIWSAKDSNGQRHVLEQY